MKNLKKNLLNPYNKQKNYKIKKFPLQIPQNQKRSNTLVSSTVCDTENMIHFLSQRGQFSPFLKKKIFFRKRFSFRKIIFLFQIFICFNSASVYYRLSCETDRYQIVLVETFFSIWILLEKKIFCVHWKIEIEQCVKWKLKKIFQNHLVQRKNSETKEMIPVNSFNIETISKKSSKLLQNRSLQPISRIPKCARCRNHGIIRQVF